MRIIAGEFKSRILKGTRGHRTHPMSEKIRGALFNSVGDISGCSFLDAFSGTGAVAVEALSRGAVDVHAVEINTDSFDILKENRDSVTDADRLQVHRANVKTWIKNTRPEFDVVMADPPYDKVSMSALDTVAESVAMNGVYIISLPLAEHYRNNKFRLLDEKRYGNAKLVFYRRVK